MRADGVSFVAFLLCSLHDHWLHLGDHKNCPDLASIVDPLVFFGLVAFTILATLGNFFFGRR